MQVSRTLVADLQVLRPQIKLNLRIVNGENPGILAASPDQTIVCSRGNDRECGALHESPTVADLSESRPGPTARRPGQRVVRIHVDPDALELGFSGTLG